MAILLKTTSVRVSSIQIMQVRVQNKGKSVWKSRYVGDVSRPRAFEEAHRCNIQAKFYNEKFPLVYESGKIGDSLS